MIFAWKYSISKDNEKQDMDDWLLQQAMRQLFFKAEMQRTTKDTKTWNLLIYTFKPMTMRPYYPMESDYVASCLVGEKNLLQVDRLELHGCFMQEYDALHWTKRRHIFKSIVLHLRTNLSRYIPWDDEKRKKMIVTPATREEYYKHVRFKKLWKFQEHPQERPKPLIEMEVHDRDYGVFDVLPKKNKHEAMVEALGGERPEMRMGKRQVQAMDKNEEEKEPESIEIAGFEKKDVVFPVAKRDPNIRTIFGHDVGPTPQPKLVPLSNRLYEYHKSLTDQEKKKLPRRTDPKIRDALRVHMIAHEQPAPLGFEDAVDLFQLEEE